VTSLLHDIPRVPLAHLPTPLEPAPRLGAGIGLPRLWLKRDDCTGLALGGNKARKLEYLFAEARAQGADTVFTTGGLQSNHARMTAAAACKLEMRSVLYLCDPEPVEHQGNLLLDAIFGADVCYLPGLDLHEMHSRMAADAARMGEQGRKAYIIPVGGSTPLGCLGYVRAVEEVARQAAEQGFDVDAMTVATGSTGTLAGILLGVRLFMPGCRVYGISVAPSAPAGQRRCARIIAEAAAMLGVDWQPEPDAVPVYDDWLGAGYGVPTDDGMAAIDLAARTEGVLLDPVYTAKALAGTRGLAQRGELRAEETVLFWHTGGAPALFAFEKLFAGRYGPGETMTG
jgi:D-cysteine desulfhydrase family pyridoxal phosphate-dependent enzyme